MSMCILSCNAMQTGLRECGSRSVGHVIWNSITPVREAEAAVDAMKQHELLFA